MSGLFDVSELSRDLVLLLDRATGHRLLPGTLVLILLVVLVLAVTLTAADAVAAALLKYRAGRLPPSLGERLLEEWLAEAATASRVRKLTFALSLLLTRSDTLVRALTDEGDALPAGWEVLSDATAKVPADLGPRLVAAIVDAILTIALGTTLMTFVALPIPYRPLDTFLVGIPVALFLHGWCVVRFGGSPGKLLMKLRLVVHGEEAMTLRRAILRLTPALLFSVPVAIVTTMSLWLSGVDAHAYSALSPARQAALATALAPALFKMLGLAREGFAVADLFMAYHNADHRSLRDVIAGTVVIYAVPRVVADSTGVTTSGATSAMR